MPHSCALRAALQDSNAGRIGPVLRRMWADGGVRGLFRGNLASVVKVFPSSAIQFAVRRGRGALEGPLEICRLCRYRRGMAWRACWRYRRGVTWRACWRYRRGVAWRACWRYRRGAAWPACWRGHRKSLRPGAPQPPPPPPPSLLVAGV